MKLLFLVIVGLFYLDAAQGESGKDENIIIVCEPMKSEKSKLMRCQSFERSSLKSIDTWIATIP